MDNAWSQECSERTSGSRYSNKKENKKAVKPLAPTRNFTALNSNNYQQKPIIA
jgi:hypothetical protein